ncbi:type I-F CRISPR-associated protein Csy1 [Xanthomonas melonis]|uniref:Type I-F CRISPR-associated protein Csy1 n=1 Tax=Xanthomonas melonis TaxID=56456 RepID=A0ABS8NUW4_9XANT|nr:type I-F CRISPR-associated protein Csy1 [Xanthomonas melonis]MCD0258713.1 type I-F CRISPR-associated protein Csy1 [Xanthomonas melonis]MCD0266855.1 type I-F CRISPR-associated protein Csy1 [Xanthomonas melonis]MCD0277642.1 type I-F CRISPR-associated protein Csy1 [Xanthomonas melonis]
MNTEPEQLRSERFRVAIAAFIEARRQAKLKDDAAEDATGAASKYDYGTWLADAARRVGQIQAVTHVLKATHPDARGSSLHVPPGDLPRHAEIGSHLLGEDYAEDVVGNAAALDVFKFLKIEVEGRRLLDWMHAGDSDLRAALHTDADVADGWMQAFGALVRSDPQPVSHAQAKQVYWLVGDQPTDDMQYHLLQPMFSSTLAHAVHADIQDARFGETNKLARQAWRAREPHPGSYRDYRNLVARKLGGTKPQNISQLNSERGGVNYLLASLPPTWTQDRPRNLLKIGSAIDRLGYFDGVRAMVKRLADFLLTEPPSNQQTRDTRERIEQELGAQLALFAAETHARFPPGWTRDADCQLPLYERLWLDPERTELPVRSDPQHPEWNQDDEAFNAAYAFGDWPDAVADHFANWVNARLHAAGLTSVGDSEHRHWARQAIVDAAWPVPLQRRAHAGNHP